MDSSSFTANRSEISPRPIAIGALWQSLTRRRAVRDVIGVFGTWTLVVFLSTSQTVLNHVYRNQPAEWGRSLALTMLDWYILAVFTFAFLWLVRRWPLGPGRWRIAALYVAVLSVLVFFKYVLYVPLRQALYPVEGLTVSHLFMKSFLYDFFFFAAVLGVVQAIEYARSLREGALRASELQARLSTARLEILRSELQPHFLFNTFHSISTLMHRDVDAADRMLTQLGDLLRLSLQRKSVQEVPLREELAVLEPYLNILRIRFGDRLSIREDVDPSLLDVAVPLFILQPLVENAIQHGIARRAGAGRIEIRACAAGDSVQITVFDDGAGPSHENHREGIGLSNTRMRLEQLYGPGGQLFLKSHPESGTEATLMIPRKPDGGRPS